MQISLDKLAGLNQLTYVDYGKPAHTYSDSIQGFHRFLLDRMSSEGNIFPHNPRIVPSSGEESSMNAAPITQLVGLDAKTSIYCTACKAKRTKEGMIHVVDLNFPKDVCPRLCFPNENPPNIAIGL